MTEPELEQVGEREGVATLVRARLGVVVVVIAILCRLTSRFGVYRILDTQR